MHSGAYVGALGDDGAPAAPNIGTGALDQESDIVASHWSSWFGTQLESY